MEAETKIQKAPATSTVTQKTAPATSQPVQTSFRDYVKYNVKPIVVHVLSGNILGYIVARMAPPATSLKMLSESTLSRLKQLHILTPDAKWHAAVVAQITGVIGGIYAGYRVWKRNEASRLSIKDIHKDVTNAIDPGEMEAQMEQNQRIQNGIRQIVAHGTTDSHAKQYALDQMNSQRQFVTKY